MVCFEVSKYPRFMTNSLDKTPPFRLETKEGSIIIQSLGQIICRPPYSVRDKIYPIGFKRY